MIRNELLSLIEYFDNDDIDCSLGDLLRYTFRYQIKTELANIPDDVGENMTETFHWCVEKFGLPCFTNAKLCAIPGHGDVVAAFGHNWYVNHKATWDYIDDNFCFLYKEDALLFKLTWG